jgi:hypothetical protein
LKLSASSDNIVLLTIRLVSWAAGVLVVDPDQATLPADVDVDQIPPGQTMFRIAGDYEKLAKRAARRLRNSQK